MLFRPMRDEGNSTTIRRPLGQFILKETRRQLSCRTLFSDIIISQRSRLILPCLCGRAQTINRMLSGCREPDIFWTFYACQGCRSEYRRLIFARSDHSISVRGAKQHWRHVHRTRRVWTGIIYCSGVAVYVVALIYT